MTMFFKMLCLSFATITLCAVALSLFFSWCAFNPKNNADTVDRCSDRVYQCVHVAQWTLLAAGINGIVWCVLECLEYLWVLQYA